MSTRLVGPSRVVAAFGAAAIAAVSTWAFVSSTASTDRDPFHFAAIMSANANAGARVVQLQRLTASACRNNPETRDHRAPVCLKG